MCEEAKESKKKCTMGKLDRADELRHIVSVACSRAQWSCLAGGELNLRFELAVFLREERNEVDWKLSDLRDSHHGRSADPIYIVYRSCRAAYEREPTVTLIRTNTWNKHLAMHMFIEPPPQATECPPSLNQSFLVVPSRRVVELESDIEAFEKRFIGT